MKTIVFLICLLIGFGCDITKTEKYKYTIFIGTATFASGYYTDSYIIKDRMIIFTTNTGAEYTVPECNVLKIEKNNTKE